LLAGRLPRMRSARSANGPKIMAVPSHASVDLPRSRAMSYAAGIEATETSAMISDADMSDPFAAPRIPRNWRRLAASAKSEAASGTGAAALMSGRCEIGKSSAGYPAHG
jgi:hypothetical protein